MRPKHTAGTFLALEIRSLPAEFRSCVGPELNGSVINSFSGVDRSGSLSSLWIFFIWNANYGPVGHTIYDVSSSGVARDWVHENFVASEKKQEMKSVWNETNKKQQPFFIVYFSAGHNFPICSARRKRKRERRPISRCCWLAWRVIFVLGKKRDIILAREYSQPRSPSVKLNSNGKNKEKTPTSPSGWSRDDVVGARKIKKEIIFIFPLCLVET